MKEIIDDAKNCEPILKGKNGIQRTRQIPVSDESDSYGVLNPKKLRFDHSEDLGQ